MAFRPSDLQEAFFVPGTHNFRVWGYGTVDALEEVLRPGYFAGTQLQPGELIYVNARRRKKASGRAQDQGPADVHMALLMVARAAERGAARRAPSVRLVQDFGCPDDPMAALVTATHAALAPSLEAVPIKRGRGRPPGSRARKNGALSTLSVD